MTDQPARRTHSRRFLALVALAAVASPGPGRAADPQPLRILASFPPVACFAMNVAGEAGAVEVLLPPNVGPHDYSMTPGDLKKIAAADVIITNGLGLEEWLEKGIRNAAKRQAVRVAAGEGLPGLISGAAGHEGHDHRGHDHGGVNPHVWLDPVLAVSMVEKIRDELAKARPEQAQVFADNARAYIARLQKLDEELRVGIGALGGPAIVTFHDAFPYFARRYGIGMAGVFELSPGRDPSPKHLAALTKMLREREARALFAEPQYSPKLMQTVAKETGVPVGVLDPMQTGRASPGLYEEVMRANLAALRDTLDGRP